MLGLRVLEHVAVAAVELIPRRYGNVCDRLTLPSGRVLLRYDAHVEVPGVVDDCDKEARQVPVEALPDEALAFLLPSRFCLSDVLQQRA